jgi:hypothetical protein
LVPWLWGRGWLAGTSASATSPDAEQIFELAAEVARLVRINLPAAAEHGAEDLAEPAASLAAAAGAILDLFDARAARRVAAEDALEDLDRVHGASVRTAP